MQDGLAVAVKRPRARDASATRDAIIVQAAKLFYERGFLGVTIEEICASLRPALTKGAYYHIFDSKEAVLSAIHDKYMNEAIEFVNELAGLNPLQQFDALFEHSAKMLGTLRPFVVVTILEQRHLRGDYAKRANAKRRAYRDIIERIVRAGQNERRFRTDIDATIITLNYFAIVNWMYMWYRTNGNLRREVVVAMCREQFMGGIVDRK